MIIIEFSVYYKNFSSSVYYIIQFFQKPTDISLFLSSGSKIQSPQLRIEKEHFTSATSNAVNLSRLNDLISISSRVPGLNNFVWQHLASPDFGPTSKSISSRLVSRVSITLSDYISLRQISTCLPANLHVFLF